MFGWLTRHHWTNKGLFLNLIGNNKETTVLNFTLLKNNQRRKDTFIDIYEIVYVKISSIRLLIRLILTITRLKIDPVEFGTLLEK